MINLQFWCLSEMSIFNCDKCGLCCQNLHTNEIYSDLDRGDGTCIHFDETQKICRIYENRPLKCKIDAMYDAVYKDLMNREDYYDANYAACLVLKKMNDKEK
jgi:Fe-S-cluster containining protein